MKKAFIPLLLGLVLAGCSNGDGDEPGGTEPGDDLFASKTIDRPSDASMKRVEMNSTYNTEDWFIRGTTFHFYFVDAFGNDLINKDNPSSWPVSTLDFVQNPVELTADVENRGTHIIGGQPEFAYNGRRNRFRYDEEKELYACDISFWGNKSSKICSFPVYVNGGIDIIDVTYEYEWDVPVDGGPGPYSRIVDVRYNGAWIYSDDVDPESVVIQWNKDGSRTVIPQRSKLN